MKAQRIVPIMINSAIVQGNCESGCKIRIMLLVILLSKKFLFRYNQTGMIYDFVVRRL